MADEAETGQVHQAPLDFPGFAQEFLRRNPAYRRAYASVMSDAHSSPAAREVMAQGWGLCFPLSAR